MESKLWKWATFSVPFQSECVTNCTNTTITSMMSLLLNFILFEKRGEFIKQRHLMTNLNLYGWFEWAIAAELFNDDNQQHVKCELQRKLLVFNG